MPSPRSAARLYALFALACVAALTWPLYPWLDAAVDARPFGLPFGLAWHVGWVAASFVALAAYDRAVHGGRA